MPPKQAKTVKKTQNPALQEELLAIKLLYCVQNRPKDQQKRVKESIQQTLKTALFRVISNVEKTLQSKGYFKGSETLLEDYRSVIDLMIQRTDIVVIRQFLHQFYEKGLPSLQVNKLIAFYSSLVEIMQKMKLKNLKMEINYFNLDDDQPEQNMPTEQSQLKQTKIYSNQQKIKASSIVQISQDQIIEVAQQSKGQLSEESKAFIRDFTSGYKSVQKGKYKVVKRLKIACLKPGEPIQNWEYYDSLQGGMVKLTFISIKQA